jgi:uncharacterized Zn-finger protein
MKEIPISLSNKIIQQNLFCESCKKMFQFKSEYKKHMRIHTGEKPFVCEYPNCFVKFAQVIIMII